MINDPQLAEPGSEQARLLSQIDAERLPQHIAVIMDGNGRWAKARNRPRVEGHRAGVESVRGLVEACARLQIGYLTLYAFSQENWKRPPAEISTLMELLQLFAKRELPKMMEHNVRFQTIGRIGDLPRPAQKALELSIEKTAHNDGLVLTLALSYGGRAELVDAARELLRSGVAEDQVDEAAVARCLYTRNMPDPDLLIRTSGEQRLSNFLLWQAAYAEFWVTPTLWPEFRNKQLFEALLSYQQRERRFGSVSAAVAEPG